MMKYKLGFILSTALGNKFRYDTLRKFAERVDDVECEWAPVKHFYAPGERDPVRFVPSPLYKRAVVLAQSWPILGRLKAFDAVMIHQHETQAVAALRSLLVRNPPVIAAQDNPPRLFPDDFPLYQDRENARWRQKLRLVTDLWTARRTPYHLAFSGWQASVLEAGKIAADRIRAIHTGLDLSEWSTKSPRDLDPLPCILFVGGDFERKGGRQLFEVFREKLQGKARLAVVTSPDNTLAHPDVEVHHNVSAGSDQIKALYSKADMLVLPTKADFSSWVSLEAMAMGLPVIATPVGGIRNIVEHGKTGFLVPPDDKRSLALAIETLLADKELRHSMGLNGRARVEAYFDASKNVPKMLDFMKLAADQHRSRN